jgi:hypothetical protein
LPPGDASLHRRVTQVASDPARNLVLRLGSIESAGEPGVSWEVHVTSPQSSGADTSSTLVGVISLYGLSENSEFSFALDTAITGAGREGLDIVFTPVSGIEMDGRPVPPRVLHPVRIGAICLVSERADD